MVMGFQWVVHMSAVVSQGVAFHLVVEMMDAVQEHWVVEAPCVHGPCFDRGIDG